MNIVGLNQALSIKDNTLVRQASEDFQRMQSMRQDKRQRDARREARNIDKELRNLTR